MGDNFTQTIEFDGTDEKHFAEITSDDVVIISSPGDHELGCSKVTLKNVVDFNWEHKLYLGHVVAVHMLRKYIAYGIKAKSGGMVRIINRDSTVRGIIKGLVGQPQDLAFAHIETQIILASVDEEGNLFVHSIESPDVVCVLKLHIPYNSTSPVTHRVIWCPYIPEPVNSCEIDEETAKLLVVTHGSEAIMISVNTVIKKYGSTPMANGLFVKEGMLELINEHSQPITDAMFAPDGTAIATASCDGEIKFFQVYMHGDVENKPRCLHQWKPHGGKAVSSLFFLDNHKNHNPDVQYWKFAITGCDNNSELKLWSCQSWSCLQTIVIRPNPKIKHMTGGNHLTLKASLDKSAQYLVLSDVYNRVMYIMQIIKYDDETNVFIKSVSEFLLPCCILSFDIVGTGLLDYNNINNCQDDLYDLEVDNADIDNDEIDDFLPVSPMLNCNLRQFKRSRKGVIVKLYLVQPKSLQECRVIYHPQINYSTTVLNMLSRDSLSFRDELEDISVTSSQVDKKKSSSNDDLNKQNVKDIVTQNEYNIPPIQQSTPLQMVQPPPPPSQINLMTPDAFSSLKKDFTGSSQALPSSKDDSKEEIKLTGENPLKAFDSSVLEARVSASPTIMDQKFIDDLMYLGTKRLENVEPPKATSSDNLVYDKKSRDGNFASGGSSPSREVQEILSLKDSRSDILDFDLMDDGEVQEPASGVVSNISQTLKPLTTKSTSSNEVNKVEVNAIDGGWPNPPKLDSKSTLDNNCNTSTNSIGNSNVFTPYSNMNNVSKDEGQFIEKSLEKILGVLSQQTKQIQNLQLEVKQLHENEKLLHNMFIENSNNSIKSNNLNLENLIEQAFSKNQVQQSKLLESLLSSRATNQTAEINHTVSQSILQVLNKQFIDKFSANFTLEVQRCVLPSVVSSLDSLKLAMQQDMAKKLTTTDNLLREHIMKLTQNKHTIDMLSNALLLGAQSALNNTLKEHMATSLIPSFERATNQMFKQMHETFSQGTKDYLINFELTMEKNRRQMDKTKDIMTHMDQLSENIRIHTDATSSINKHVYESISKSMKVMQENLVKIINENVNTAFSKLSEQLEDNVKCAVRSNSVTPSLHANDSMSLQSKIDHSLSQKDISGAFQHALMASDLSLVVYVCEKVDPTLLFKETPCPLPQNVLLSLIQQLSADLLNQAELKHRYLQEALMNLDTKNACILEHLPVVLKALKKQLMSFISQHPNNSVTKGIRMLSMVTDSLLTMVSSNNITPKKTNLGL